MVGYFQAGAVESNPAAVFMKMMPRSEGLDADMLVTPFSRMRA